MYIQQNCPGEMAIVCGWMDPHGFHLVDTQTSTHEPRISPKQNLSILVGPVQDVRVCHRIVSVWVSLTHSSIVSMVSLIHSSIVPKVSLIHSSIVFMVSQIHSSIVSMVSHTRSSIVSMVSQIHSLIKCMVSHIHSSIMAMVSLIRSSTVYGVFDSFVHCVYSVPNHSLMGSSSSITKQCVPTNALKMS